MDRGRDRRRLRVVRHLADRLRAERPVCRRALDDHVVEVRQILRRRGQVGAELAAAMIRSGIVRVRLLEQPEAEAHHRAALDLPLDERRVDRATDVVDLDEPLDVDLPGLVVDLDLGDAGGVGDGRVRLAVDLAGVVVHARVLLERGTRAGDQLTIGPGRRGGDVGEPELAVRRPPCKHLAVGDLEIAGVDLHLLRRDLEDLLAHALGRETHGVAADERPARRERAGADRR